MAIKSLTLTFDDNRTSTCDADLISDMVINYLPEEMFDHPYLFSEVYTFLKGEVFIEGRLKVESEIPPEKIKRMSENQYYYFANLLVQGWGQCQMEKFDLTRLDLSSDLLPYGDEYEEHRQSKPPVLKPNAELHFRGWVEINAVINAEEIREIFPYPDGEGVMNYLVGDEWHTEIANGEWCPWSVEFGLGTSEDSTLKKFIRDNRSDWIFLPGHLSPWVVEDDPADYLNPMDLDISVKPIN